MPAEELVRFDEMVQVGAGVFATSLAAAARVNGLVGKFINAPFQTEFPMRSENRATLGELRGNNAVEHIHAAVHRLENIERRTDAHEIARQVFGEMFGGEAGE